jgi:hypothetical protein
MEYSDILMTRYDSPCVAVNGRGYLADMVVDCYAGNTIHDVWENRFYVLRVPISKESAMLFKTFEELDVGEKYRSRFRLVRSSLPASAIDKIENGKNGTDRIIELSESESQLVKVCDMKTDKEMLASEVI